MCPRSASSPPGRLRRHAAAFAPRRARPRGAAGGRARGLAGIVILRREHDLLDLMRTSPGSTPCAASTPRGRRGRACAAHPPRARGAFPPAEPWPARCGDRAQRLAAGGLVRGPRGRCGGARGTDGRGLHPGPPLPRPLPEVEVLARYAGEPVLVQRTVVAATFHPELTRSRALHRHLVALASARQRRPPASPTLPARPPRQLPEACTVAPAAPWSPRTPATSRTRPSPARSSAEAPARARWLRALRNWVVPRSMTKAASVTSIVA